MNLLVSAGFTYWVNHSLRTFKLPGHAEAKRPAQYQKELAGWMKNHLPIMGWFKHAETKQEIASNMAGVLTLTAAGHVVMIPSVWLGAKIKAPLVKALNRMHYGAEAMDDPTLATRHAAIEAEERPTLLGSVVGRLGTIFATQATAYTLGSSINIIKTIGERTPLKFMSRFHGLDNMTSQLGDNFGGAISAMAPKRTEAINGALRKNYGFSLRQLEQHPEIAPLSYGQKNLTGHGGGLPEHYGKYLVSDIMYSFVTAVSIAPAINFFKKFIPGLTYKPEISSTDQALLDAHRIKLNSRRLPDIRAASRDEGVMADTAATPELPGTRIAHIQPEARLAHAPQKEVQA